ncbi:MAG TPA: hypothetical protein VK129_05835, partial [Terriglobales bacterium]|nr:hypothetical protein [Terriglobales bacterium]
SATVAASPSDVFSDGASHLVQITVSGLLDSDGVTPVPDGSKIALSAINCAALNQSNGCIGSAGGQILSAGTSPGDGAPVDGNPSFALFTVAGGQVHAAYADQGVVTGISQTQTANITVRILNSNGDFLDNHAIGVGSVNLHGATSATASGPATLSISNGDQGTVTFSGIKDSAGNAVPDGTVMIATVLNCGSLNQSNGCNGSSGGTIVDGTTASWHPSFKQFTVRNGSITVTYSAVGASPGTAQVQLLPGKPDGFEIDNHSLLGGVWAISTTP